MGTISRDGTKILNNYCRFTGVQFNASVFQQLPAGSSVDNAIWFKNKPNIKNEYGITVSLGGYSKRDYEGPINVKWFGAKGDGVNDDTEAIRKAIAFANNAGYQVGGAKIYFPAGRYKITGTITVTKSQTKLFGDGVDLTHIVPVGTFSPAVKFTGPNFGQWLNGVEMRDMSISSANKISFTGNGLEVYYVGLRSVFENITINACGGKGLYIQSSFDHMYTNVEARGCGGVGVHLYEINGSTDYTLPFQEVSFLVFENVRPIANNSNGLQWWIQGCDALRLLNCKPSEGSIGIKITDLCNRIYINGAYLDGLGAYGGDSTQVSKGVVIDGEYVRSISISNMSMYRVTQGVEVVRGQGINISDIEIQNGGDTNQGIAVVVRSTCTGTVKYKPFSDAYTSKFIDETNGRLLMDVSYSYHKLNGTTVKPYTPKIQTFSVQMTIPINTGRSNVLNIPLNIPIKDMLSCYFLSAAIDNTDIFNNWDDKLRPIEVMAKMKDPSSIDVIMQAVVTDGAAYKAAITRTVRVLLISE